MCVSERIAATSNHHHVTVAIAHSGLAFSRPGKSSEALTLPSPLLPVLSCYMWVSVTEWLGPNPNVPVARTLSKSSPFPVAPNTVVAAAILLDPNPPSLTHPVFFTTAMAFAAREEGRPQAVHVLGENQYRAALGSVGRWHQLTRVVSPRGDFPCRP